MQEAEVGFQDEGVETTGWSFQNIATAWDVLVQAVSKEGQEVSPRGKKTLELVNVALVYPKPDQFTFINPVRKLNPVFHLVELFYFLNGRDDDLLCKYVGKMKDYINTWTERFDGSYGPALYHGLPKALNMLEDDPSTRRAVIPILRLDHLNPQSKDVPCNDLLAIRRRNGQLDMNIVTRSQDLYRGLLYDTLEFQLLQYMLAKALGLQVGAYGHYLFSLHLYEDDIGRADKAIGHTEADEQEPVLIDEKTWNMSRFWELARYMNALIEYPTSLTAFHDMAKAIKSYNSKKRTEIAVGPYTKWVNRWLA